MSSLSRSLRLTQDEAKRRLDMDESIIIIDIREPYEFKKGRIKNAINVSLDNVIRDIKKYARKKNTTIFLYCISGAKSIVIADILRKDGYSNAYDIGGYNTWRYETEW